MTMRAAQHQGQPQILEQEVNINQNFDGVTLSAPAADTALGQFVEFTVPDRTRYLIRANDVFAFTATATIVTASSRLQLVRVQAGGQLTQTIADVTQGIVTEFIDRNELYTIGRNIQLYPQDVLRILCTTQDVTTPAVSTGDTEFRISAMQFTTIRL